MKLINKGIIEFAVLACLILSGCSGRPIHFGNSDQQINRRNIDFSKGRELSAEASGFQLLLVIPININDRHERAYQMLRAQAGSDYLTEIKVKESWTYALVGTIYTTRLEAKAYPVSDFSSENDSSDSSFLSRIDKKISATCSKEFTIMKKELKTLDKDNFLHKCAIEKRKNFVGLGL